MSAPTGATEVHYGIGVAENPDATPPHPNYSVQFTASLEDSDPGGHQHAAIEAGADAILAYFATQFPTSNLLHERSYTGNLTGDTWPGA